MIKSMDNTKEGGRKSDIIDILYTKVNSELKLFKGVRSKIIFLSFPFNISVSNYEHEHIIIHGRSHLIVLYVFLCSSKKVILLLCRHYDLVIIPTLLGAQSFIE